MIIALLILVVLVDALFGLRVGGSDDGPPSSFEALLEYDAAYLPALSEAGVTRRCTELPAILVEAYRLEFLARRGAQMPGRWARYFESKEWYAPEKSIGAVAAELTPEERTHFEALTDCAARRGL